VHRRDSRLECLWKAVGLNYNLETRFLPAIREMKIVNTEAKVAGHYTRGGLEQTILQAVAKAGKDAARPTALPGRQHVAPGVIRDRARFLRSRGEKKASAFRAAQSGRTLRALTLARTGQDWTEALTGNYLKVKVEGRRLPNEWCDARL